MERTARSETWKIFYWVRIITRLTQWSANFSVAIREIYFFSYFTKRKKGNIYLGILLNLSIRIFHTSISSCLYRLPKSTMLKSILIFIFISWKRPKSNCHFIIQHLFTAVIDLGKLGRFEAQCWNFGVSKNVNFFLIRPRAKFIRSLVVYAAVMIDVSFQRKTLAC